MATSEVNVIVDSRYNAPEPVEMAVERETKNLTDGNFVINDAKGEVLFKPKSGLVEDEMVLLDGSGSPLLTIKKMTSGHGSWQVFKGESVKENDLLYTVKSSGLFKTKVDVFLGHNKVEEICDFRVKGIWFMRSCVVYQGESENIIAEKKPEVQKGVDNFSVTVFPNNDAAFIASLIVILDHVVRKDRSQAAIHGAVHVGVLAVVEGVIYVAPAAAAALLLLL